MSAVARTIGTLPNSHPADTKRKTQSKKKRAVHRPDPAKSRFMDTAQAADYIGMFGARHLERMRSSGNGPAYTKAGRRVMYTRETIDVWIAERTFSNTSEAKAAGHA